MYNLSNLVIYSHGPDDMAMTLITVWPELRCAKDNSYSIVVGLNCIVVGAK